MSALNMPVDNSSMTTPSPSDLATLRSLLLGKDYPELIALKEQLQDHNKYSQSIANVISEALAIRNEQDNSIANALAPTIQSALKQSIVENPKPVADALYPVMGPAIRKSISEALSQMMETFNQLLEQSFTVKSLMWRFEAWKTGRSFSEVVLLKTLTFQVEQVFLINRKDGLLLQHVAINNVVTQDGDMLSGMLTAIQDFINDSFVDDGAENTSINTLKLGDLTVFIEHSSNAIIAMVIRGKPPESIRRLQAATLEYIQKKYAVALNNFNGDSSPFDNTKHLLERCLKSQKQERKPSRLPLYIFSVIFLLGLGYWAYTFYQSKLLEQQAQITAQTLLEQQQKQWQSVINGLRAEPGLVVINDSQDQARIDILKDPLARSPETMLGEMKMEKPIAFNKQPYLSIDDSIVLQRAKQVLTPPPQVNFAVKNSLLTVTGKAPTDWSKLLQNRWRQVAGVSQLNTDDLRVFDPNLPRINALIREIESMVIPFENNKALLSEASNNLITKVGATWGQLINLANKSNKPIKLMLTGYSDSTGTELINNKLSQQRAEIVKQRLVTNGISEHIFVNAVAGKSIKRNERSVRFRVE